MGGGEAGERGLDSGLRFKVGVFVLDRDRPAIAVVAQRGQQRRPLGRRPPGPDGAEVPRHRVGLRRPAEVEDSVGGDAVGVQQRVLAVYESDRVAQALDRRDRVDALPPEVARVEVDGDVVPGDLAQASERFGVVDRCAGVQLQADPDLGGGVSGPAGELAPEGGDGLLELGRPQPLHVGQPGAAGEHRPRAAAGPGSARAAAHGHHPGEPRGRAPASTASRRACPWAAAIAGSGCSGLPDAFEGYQGQAGAGERAPEGRHARPRRWRRAGPPGRDGGPSSSRRRRAPPRRRRGRRTTGRSRRARGARGRQ